MENVGSSEYMYFMWHFPRHVVEKGFWEAFNENTVLKLESSSVEGLHYSISSYTLDIKAEASLEDRWDSRQD